MRPDGANVRFVLYPTLPDLKDSMPREKVVEFVPKRGHYRDCRYEHRELSFDLDGRIAIGPDFSATNCRVRIARGAELLIAEAEFRECTIASDSQKPSKARGARFDHCSFEGVFDCWRFGGSPVPTEPATQLIQCDFRKADLRDCEFYDCDLSEQRFRGWPTIVFVEPHLHRDQVQQAPWPKSAAGEWWVRVLTGEPPPGLGAANSDRLPKGIAVNAELVAKKFGVDPDDLRRVLETLRDIVIT